MIDSADARPSHVAHSFSFIDLLSYLRYSKRFGWALREKNEKHSLMLLAFSQVVFIVRFDVLPEGIQLIIPILFEEGKPLF
jgi:hypothetical protein